MSKLKNVLRNFLEHYETLNESHRTKLQAFKDTTESGRYTPPPLSLYDQEYLKLKELTEMLKTDSNYPMAEGLTDVNRKKNRYKDILPYDNSRVILSEYPGVPGSDYINANYVRGSSGNQRAYIACQGPLPNTLVDYWRMIWETEVLVIVMACNEREAGKYKCESYWPTNTDETQQYGNITVEHVKWRQVCPDFLVRTFRVKCDNEERTICQFHYTTWPDHGVPLSVTPILELVRLMRDVQSTESRPILVHCSAGCGRTGTLCSIDYVWALLRTGKLKEDFSLFEIICDMRRQRTSMVQTSEQYILCYKAVATLFEQHLKLIDAHTYENIDLNGDPLPIVEHPISDKEIMNKISVDTQENEEVIQVEDEDLSSMQNNNENRSEPDKDTCSISAIDKDRDKEERGIDIQEGLGNEINEQGSTNEVIEIDKNETEIPKPEASFEDSPEDPIRTEKIVGKATVIRRPSVAKLKSMFDSPSQSSDQVPEAEVTTGKNLSQQQASHSTSSQTSSQTKLRRSQSIKDSVRNLNFNIQLEIQQSRSIKSQQRDHERERKQSNKSFTVNSAKLSVYKQQHLSLDDLELEDNNTTLVKVNADIGDQDSGGETTATSSRNESSQNSESLPVQTPEVGIDEDDLNDNLQNLNLLNHPPPNLNADSPAEEYAAGNSHLLRPVPVKLSHSRELHSQPNFSRQDYFRQTFGPEDLASSGTTTAREHVPPKPPRTYQHVLDDSCILRTPEGRLFIPTSGLIPLGMKGGNGQFGDFGRKSKSIYDLSAHKYLSQTPNMMLGPGANGEMFSGQQFQHNQQFSQPHNQPQYNQQQQQPQNFLPRAQQFGAQQKPYSMSVLTSRTPLPFMGHPQMTHNPHMEMTYDMAPMTPQHFQYHQAKPIQMQNLQNMQAIQSMQNPANHQFFEPIYGTSAVGRPMTGFGIPARIPQAMQPIYHQLPPRPRSISHGQFKPMNYENIYSNREICLQQMPQNIQLPVSQIPPQNLQQQHQQQQQQMHQFASTSGLTVAPLPFPRPAENIYAEIRNLQTPSTVPQKANPINSENVQQTPQKLQIKADNSLVNSGSKQLSSSQQSSPAIDNGKNRSFTNWKSVFKVFSRSGSKITPMEAGTQNNAFPGKDGNSENGKRTNAINTSNLISGSKIGSRETNSTSGGQINPLNGQPLSRPPHSHRFHQQSQWTQV